MKKTNDNQDKVILNQQNVIIKYAEKVKDLKQLLHLLEKQLKVVRHFTSGSSAGLCGIDPAQGVRRNFPPENPKSKFSACSMQT